MKKLLVSTASFVALTILILGSQTGCEKETINNTITKTDTVFICVPLTKDSILVQKTWKVDHVYSLISGTLAKYVNGGVNTTGINFDNQKYRFNSNGTGTFTGPSADNHPLTWQFTTADKRTISIAIAGVNTSTWEIVEIADNYLQFSVSTNGGNLSTYRLKQIP